MEPAGRQERSVHIRLLHVKIPHQVEKHRRSKTDRIALTALSVITIWQRIRKGVAEARG
jgi:hypothetical protein